MCLSPLFSNLFFSTPENLKNLGKKPEIKYQIKFFREIAFQAVHFPSSKIDFWPFLK